MKYNPNKIVATIYAIGLGIGEAVMNWGNWQYAPLWIVDYIIVVWLLIGVFVRSHEKSQSILKGAWAFSLGVMYMALAVITSPENAVAVPVVINYLISLLIAVSLIGLYLSYRKRKE